MAIFVFSYLSKFPSHRNVLCLISCALSPSSPLPSPTTKHTQTHFHTNYCKEAIPYRHRQSTSNNGEDI